MELNPITSEEIAPGMVVVDIGPSSVPGGLQTSIEVGRVLEGSIQRNDLMSVLSSGIVAEFDMLEPEEYQRARQVIYTTFFASQQRPADWPAPGVYAWPETLLPLTFDEHRPPGWRKHVQIKFKNIAPLLTLEQ